MARWRWGTMVVLATAVGCGPGGDGADAAGGADAGRTGEDAGADGGEAVEPDGGAPDGGRPVEERAPCESASCWLETPGLRACGESSVAEDFSTGLYAVHRYALAVGADVSVEVTLAVTGGSWAPALIVQDDTGLTLYDGERARAGGAITVTGLESGRGGASARLGVSSTADATLHVFVTSWAVVDSGFTSSPPREATYTLTTSADCPAGDSVCPIDPSNIDFFNSGWYEDYDSPYRSPSDSRPSHHGYDIHAAMGVELVATQGGTIAEAMTVADEFCGLAVNLSADSGVTFRYCHMSAVDVRAGERVEVGQRLGAVGATGNAHLPHVHFGYLDAPDVVGSGLTSTADLRSEAVNAYVDALCR